MKRGPYERKCVSTGSGSLFGFLHSAGEVLALLVVPCVPVRSVTLLEDVRCLFSGLIIILLLLSLFYFKL